MPLVTDDGWSPPITCRRPHNSLWLARGDMSCGDVMCSILSCRSLECEAIRSGVCANSGTTNNPSQNNNHTNNAITIAHSGGTGGASPTSCYIIFLIILITIFCHCRSTFAIPASVTSSSHDMSSDGTDSSLNNRTWPAWALPDPQQCVLVEKNLAERICGNIAFDKRHSEVWKVRLTHCSKYRVAQVLNPETCRLAGTQDECRSCLNEIDCLDKSVYAMIRQFEYLLEAVDCGSDYSTHWRCKHCQDAYKDWLCSVMIPYYLTGSLVPPCPDYCDMVVKRCPYFLPSKEFQYAGEPTFLCTGSPSSHIISDLDHQADEIINNQQCHRSCPSDGICLSATKGNLPLDMTHKEPSLSVNSRVVRQMSNESLLISPLSQPSSASYQVFNHSIVPPPDVQSDSYSGTATSSASSVYHLPRYHYHHRHHFFNSYSSESPRSHSQSEHSLYFDSYYSRHQHLLSSVMVTFSSRCWSRFWWFINRTPWIVVLQLVLLWFMQTLAHHHVIGLT